ALIITIGLCFGAEMIFSHPAFGAVLGGLVPTGQIITDPNMLYIAIGILGATVMPHNLYLHSSLVQTRMAPSTAKAIQRALRYNLVDTLVALNVAFVINASILVLAANVFHASAIVVTDLREAQRLLSPLLGTTLAGLLFAVALLAAGQSSTITGTLAGQIAMQGFLRLRGSPLAVRFVTRAIAVFPAVALLAIEGDGATASLLVATQVVLSLQLPFALVPLIRFTASREVMGDYASVSWIRLLAWLGAALIVACGAWLVAQMLAQTLSPAIVPVVAIVAVAGVVLLVYLACAPLRVRGAVTANR
ncbi:MAG TPA: divalent metal cation transporter, partial [Casimicrobiaceae bacterium]|nr:divalent metal cation transporter [Casimicrobiaceae bacterium]